MEGIRLNRFIAMCGVCSRRKADDLIKEGKVTINKQVIYNLGYRVSPRDNIFVNGQLIFIEKKRYVLLNKPMGYITTMSDEKGRSTVVSLIKNFFNERVVPVGRLDKNTTGLLLFTNDGMLSKKLMHPKYNVQKTYHVHLDKAMKESDFKKIEQGFELEDGPIKPIELKYIGVAHLSITIHIGRNRIVRRLFQFLGYNVIKLDRVAYGCLTKNKLSLGKWRELTKKEIESLHKNN